MFLRKWWKSVTLLVVIVGLLVGFNNPQIKSQEGHCTASVLDVPTTESQQTVTNSVTEEVAEQPEVVKEHVRQYQISYTDTEFDKYLLHVMRDFGINLDVSYIYATIFCESTFRTGVVSPYGAVGFMQVLPSTRDYIYPTIINRFPQYTGLSRDLYNPYVNVVYGLYYFRYIAENFGEYEVNENNIRKVLTCYNRGVGGGRSYYRSTGHWNSGYASKIVKVAENIRINGGI